jgi:hypothetical protein
MDAGTKAARHREWMQGLARRKTEQEAYQHQLYDRQRARLRKERDQLGILGDDE